MICNVHHSVNINYGQCLKIKVANNTQRCRDCDAQQFLVVLMRCGGSEKFYPLHGCFALCGAHLRCREV